MSSYVVSPQADEDIFEIWRYLCQKASLDVANRVEEEIYSAFEALDHNPGLGHQRSDLTSHPRPPAPAAIRPFCFSPESARPYRPRMPVFSKMCFT